MELIDGDKEYKLSVELPGMTDKDVEIAVADGVLTISGEKKEETERKDEGYLVSERRYGSFKRQIALPADVQPDAIKARFGNGVLNVTLGKDQKAQSRQHKIPIES
jgi:HSP20 family protein